MCFNTLNYKIFVKNSKFHVQSPIHKQMMGRRLQIENDSISFHFQKRPGRLLQDAANTVFSRAAGTLTCFYCYVTTEVPGFWH